MKTPFGHTRSRVTSQYALITPDTHVVSPLVDWTNAEQVTHVSPEMGARFWQYTARLGPAAEAASPPSGVERFVYVFAGSIELELDGKQTLTEGGYAFLPADTPHRIATKNAAELVVFEKKYIPHPLADPPQPLIGREQEVPGEPYFDDEEARLQTLLPVDPAFDMAVNRFTYQPGATLPQVEIHRMEHGLLMQSGAGVYRLGDDYFPVQAGDVIWMASYCPQWFVAMSKEPASYLYYKDVHRDELTDGL